MWATAGEPVTALKLQRRRLAKAMPKSLSCRPQKISNFILIHDMVYVVSAVIHEGT